MKQIVAQTKNWISTFVIGYNLCPFAAKPFAEDRIRYVVYDGDQVKELMELVYLECFVLKNKSAEEVETTMIIHSSVGTSFETYLDLFEQLEDGLSSFELEELVQLASFHPDYQFAGTEYTDAENFTNRSPYPMIHLLRSDSVTLAIDTHPDTAAIPEANIERMNQIGTPELIKKNNEIIGKN